MTITLDIRQDAAVELARGAAAQGVDIETYLTRLIERAAAQLPVSGPAEIEGRVLDAGPGSVTGLSDDWNKPMSDEEAEAFWSGRR